MKSQLLLSSALLAFLLLPGPTLVQAHKSIEDTEILETPDADGLEYARDPESKHIPSSRFKDMANQGMPSDFVFPDPGSMSREERFEYYARKYQTELMCAVPVAFLSLFVFFYGRSKNNQIALAWM